jgi:hypothetical protein
METAPKTVYCNYCAAYVHTSEIEFVNGTHVHLEQDSDDRGHDIAEDYPIGELEAGVDYMPVSDKKDQIPAIMKLLEPVYVYDEPMANSWDTGCGAVLHGKTVLGNDLEHTCYKEAGHDGLHSCFMAPNACDNKGWS